MRVRHVISFPAYRSLVLLAALAAGCGASAPRPQQVNLSGYSAAFRQGFGDGCDSVGALRAAKRDEARFRADADYAMGWRDGYAICSKR